MTGLASAFQKALYARLNGALGVPVYDKVPQDTPFPYVTIGDDTEIDWSTKDSPGKESTISIHTWSRYAGRLETKELLGKIEALLGDRPLTIPGYWNLLLYADFSTTMLDDDGVTYHGVIRFRALTHQS